MIPYNRAIFLIGAMVENPSMVADNGSLNSGCGRKGRAGIGWYGIGLLLCNEFEMKWKMGRERNPHPPASTAVPRRG